MLSWGEMVFGVESPPEITKDEHKKPKAAAPHARSISVEDYKIAKSIVYDHARRKKSRELCAQALRDAGLFIKNEHRYITEGYREYVVNNGTLFDNEGVNRMTKMQVREILDLGVVNGFDNSTIFKQLVNAKLHRVYKEASLVHKLSVLRRRHRERSFKDVTP